MSNLIEQFFVSNSFSLTSTKKAAFKESMEWKNIFDKTMLELFDKNNNTARHTDNTSQQQVFSEQQNNNGNVNQQKHDLPVKNENNQTNNVSGQKDQSTKELSELVNRTSAEKTNNINYAAYGTVSSEKEMAQIKTLVNNAANSTNLNRYSLLMQNQSMARIHLSKADSGIKIFVRNNQIDENSVLKILKGVVEKISHSDIAIQEIRLNGKTIQI